MSARLYTATELSPELQTFRRNTWNSWVRTHAESRGDEIAFRFLGQDTSWAQLDANVESFADALVRRGVEPGDRVLIMALNCTEFVETVLGANRIGAIAVPINFRLTPPEIAYLVGDCTPKVVVTDALLAPLVPAIAAAGGEIGHHIVIGGEPGTEGQTTWADALAEDGDPHPEIDVPEDAVSLIMYTSGTTGRPKGAMLTHQNMVAQALTCIRVFQQFDQASIGICAVPMFHIAALGAIAPSLQLGTRTVINPLQEFDPGQFLDTCAAEGITSVFLVPVQWQAVCAEQNARPRELAFRNISWGAAPATDTILRAMAETFPDALNSAVFGQTEMSPITCALEGGDALRKIGSVGKVIPTIRARVLDPLGEDVAPGEIGEIVYRGPTMMAGYWNKPEETAKAFEGGWFHSGDLVRIDSEGFVYVVDRVKDMIISGGENIYCAEVENAIAGYERVREVAVVGRKDEKWGETPVAVIAPAGDGADITVEELREYLADKLARYKQPRDVVIVDQLPRNASGKVTKHTLRSEIGAGA
ncbi:long-chain-fatty-acid--CoA ligase [Dietzia sp.]|uniref:long-chain-fatty-acid--CoA ligase n=1 Tax=Dietzia sp. TaxID=1871616 RepID=UPI002FD8EAE9